jgi:dihydroxy-acid dehydratase
VIRPLERPYSRQAPIVVLHGNLAPESAIVKLGLRGLDRKAKFSGPARVYDDATLAMSDIRNGTVKVGEVLVVRGMGTKGGPAMGGNASGIVFALDSAGLQSDVAFVTDGQLSGLCNKGLTVAEVSPESAVGGPLALVEDGDRIDIDVDGRSLELRVAAAELAARRARRGEPPLPPSTGYLSIYQRTVQPMSSGAGLIKQP